MTVHIRERAALLRPSFSRVRVAAWVLLAVLGGASSGLADSSGVRISQKVPVMSAEEAVRYVEAHRDEFSGTSLVGPIMNGHAELLEAILRAGFDVNEAPGQPKPAMRLAVQPCAAKKLTTEQILTTIEVLLAHGAEVNEPPGAVLTPLVVAAQWCPGPVLKRLIEAGADVDYKTNLGHTALSMAFLMKNLDAAEALIDGGATLSEAAARKLLEKGEGDARLEALVAKAGKVE